MTEENCCPPRMLTRLKDFCVNKNKYQNEYKLLKHSLLTLLLLVAIQAALLYALQGVNPTSLKYAPWLFYTSITIVSITLAIAHLKSYTCKINCMTGMMIGMTLGMQTGMMLGTILGATNGLFIGGLVAMCIAVLVGARTGNCCGIMGVMEGMMAGTMGGVMGAMIGTMFSVDHISWFMPPFMLINILIMLGLSIMIYEEIVVPHKPQPHTTTFTWFAGWCMLATLLLSAVIIFGPKTGIAALG